jgi:hypothetical protein
MRRNSTRSGMRLYLADYHLACGNLEEAEALINETGSQADLLRERLCRRLAQERGVSFEEALQEHLAEHRAFWADYAGDGTIVDILRHALWPNAQADQTAQRL